MQYVRYLPVWGTPKDMKHVMDDLFGPFTDVPDILPAEFEVAIVFNPYRLNEELEPINGERRLTLEELTH